MHTPTDEERPAAGPAGDADDPLGALADWVGTWRGRGRGDFPTIDAFDYVEEVTFAATGKPVLAYAQRTRAVVDDRPLHAETGYLRRTDPTRREGPLEWVLAQPTGLAETAVGTLHGGVVDVAGRPHRTPTAVEVREVRRRYERDGDTLVYDLWMATGDVATLTHHLHATLHRVAETG